MVWNLSLKKLFLQQSKDIQKLYDELEEMFLQADVGNTLTQELIRVLKKQGVNSADEAIPLLKEKMLKIVTVGGPFELPQDKPIVFFFVGVNGTGKTTTIGKLAYRWKKQGLDVLLVAADTYRAAAKDQLRIWADRSGSDLVGGSLNADPASVVYDGLKAAIARDRDIVMVDTAGRLHTKTHLMEELKKVVSMTFKVLQKKPDGIFLTLDATVGQNGLIQAKVFQEIIPLTDLILTKYDSTAKGGILLSVIEETGLPLRFVGMGEGIDDLVPFDAIKFVEGIFVINT